MTPESPRSPADDTETQGRPINVKRARQGGPGFRMLWVLIVSAGAAALVLLGLWLASQGGFSDTNANVGGQPVDAQAFQEEAPPPAQTQPN